MKSACGLADPRVSLGNWVFARFKGENIVLTVERDLSGPFHVIELEPSTFQALERFAEQIGWRPQ